MIQIKIQGAEARTCDVTNSAPPNDIPILRFLGVLPGSPSWGQGSPVGPDPGSTHREGDDDVE